MIDGLALAQSMLATLGALLMLGLGFVPRPNRATLYWSLAFLLAVATTYTAFVAEAAGHEQIRRGALGAMLAATALIWSGTRAWRGASSMSWAALLFGFVAAATLALVPDAVYDLSFRIAFAVSAAFAVAVVPQLRRIPQRDDRMLLPLIAVSIGFGVAGVILVVTIPAGLGGAGDALGLARLLNGIGMLVYILCGLVSVLHLAQQVPVGQPARLPDWALFRTTAAERLTRARDRGERAWALLKIDIDDIDDVRSAASDIGFAAIVANLEAVTRTAFPADADMGRQSPGSIVVLIPRPTDVVREQVRSLLSRITQMDSGQHTLQLSASVGWAPVEIVGHDFEDLLRAARTAVKTAASEGGDRWHRVTA